MENVPVLMTSSIFQGYFVMPIKYFVKQGTQIIWHLAFILSRLKNNQEISKTGMVILEVGMLSGFSLSPGSAAPTNLIRKVEILPGKVSLYLDSVSVSSCCHFVGRHEKLWRFLLHFTLTSLLPLASEINRKYVSYTRYLYTFPRYERI